MKTLLKYNDWLTLQNREPKIGDIVHFVHTDPSGGNYFWIKCEVDESLIKYDIDDLFVEIEYNTTKNILLKFVKWAHKFWFNTTTWEERENKYLKVINNFIKDENIQ